MKHQTDNINEWTMQDAIDSLFGRCCNITTEKHKKWVKQLTEKFKK